MQYCNQEKFLDNIREILTTSFDISDFSAISNAYEAFIKGFNENNPNTYQTIQTINKSAFLPLSNDEVFLNDFLSANYKVGVDLPTLISSSNTINKTIMIIAEDPLRNMPPNEIILSTPFGTHLETAKKGKQKIYWAISQMIFSMGYDLYYTDINKIWLKKNDLEKTEKKRAIPSDLKENFSKTLDREISIFRPRLVITFGKPAKEAFEALNKNIVHLPITHPAGTARGHWKKLLEKVTDKDITEYIQNKIISLNA